MLSAGLPIGALSRQTGVKVPTIRYYETIGLLPAPARTESNRRLYGGDEVRRLQFIRHARQLGFEIEEIRQLLDLAGHPNQPCERADEIALQHLEAVNRRIEQLAALRAELRRMVKECKGGSVHECRIMGVISDHRECEHERH